MESRTAGNGPAPAFALADGERDNVSWRARHGWYGAAVAGSRDDPHAGRSLRGASARVDFPSDDDA
ncbi:hypothetical protein ACQSSU_22530 [Micromonospora echinospora]